MGASFLINQIEDVDTDRLNKKLYLIANGELSIRQAYIETILMIFLPLFSLAFTRMDLVIVMALAFLITGWCYSCWPFILKNRPFGGMIANILGYYVVFAFGWMIKGEPAPLMLWHATPYVLGILAVYFFTTIPDIEGDQSAGKTTLAVKYGQKSLIRAGLIANTLAVISSAFVKDFVVLLPSFFVMPFYIHSLLANSKKSVLITTRYATLFLSIMICVRFPLYLIVITTLFFFARWYYKERFNVVYPSFNAR